MRNADIVGAIRIARSPWTWTIVLRWRRYQWYCLCSVGFRSLVPFLAGEGLGAGCRFLN
jgi:hypothetical protein